MSGQSYRPEKLMTEASLNAEDPRAAMQQMVQQYMGLYAQQKWDEWIDLWAEDGVLEFPFAPPGRKSRYVGKAEIMAYMKATHARMSGIIQTEGMEYFRIQPMADPGMTCLEMAIKGKVVATGAPYCQKYISIIEMRGDKLATYREYWNPLVSSDANGGREAWTAAFGSPEAAEAAKGEGGAA